MSKIRWRLLFPIVAVAALFSLVGCSKSDEGDDTTKKSTSGGDSTGKTPSKGGGAETPKPD